MFGKRVTFWLIVAALVALPLLLTSDAQAEGGAHRSDTGSTQVKSTKG